MAVAVMVGGFPRKAGMERKDVMSKNVSIYKSQAAALEKHAAQGVKVRRSLWYVQLGLYEMQRPTQQVGEQMFPDQCSLVYVQDAFGRLACLCDFKPWLNRGWVGAECAHALGGRCWWWPTQPTPMRSSCARTHRASRPRTSLP